MRCFVLSSAQETVCRALEAMAGGRDYGPGVTRALAALMFTLLADRLGELAGQEGRAGGGRGLGWHAGGRRHHGHLWDLARVALLGAIHQMPSPLPFLHY